jgi:ribosomal protein S18 acetylase RimI-like enzyme
LRRIERLGPGDDAAVAAAEGLFDGPAQAAATRRFLGDRLHHLLLAYEDGQPAGFVSGVEVTHPDKGTEMFLYELAVDPAFQRRGIGAALVEALAELAAGAGCYGMFVLTERDNSAAMATYQRAGGAVEGDHVMLGWQFGPPEP